MNKATMLGSPAEDYETETALQCARECLADRSICKAFGLYSDVEPTGRVSCRHYDELSFVVYDPSSVIYYAGNSTISFP